MCNATVPETNPCQCDGADDSEQRLGTRLNSSVARGRAVQIT